MAGKVLYNSCTGIEQVPGVLGKAPPAGISPRTRGVGTRMRGNSVSSEQSQPGSLPNWLRRWFDSHSHAFGNAEPAGVDWLRCLPFLAMHLAVLGVFWTGWSVAALAVGAASFLIRMFAITGFYHRYFSHRALSHVTPLPGLHGVTGRLRRAEGIRCGGHPTTCSIMPTPMPPETRTRRAWRASSAVTRAGS